MSRGPLLSFLSLLAFAASCCALFPPPAFAAEESAGARHLTLREAMSMAVAAAPDVAVAKALARRATGAAAEVRSLNLPQLVAGTGLAYNNGFPLSIEGSAPSIVQAGISQPLFSTRNRRLREEAELAAKAADLGIETAGNEVASAAALVYAELHYSRRAMAIWEERLQALKRQAAAEADLVEAGRERPLDLMRVEGTIVAAQQQLAAFAEESRLAELELRILTGITGGDRITTEAPILQSELLGTSADQLFQRILQTHPELRRAETDLRAKHLHVDAEAAAKYPKFDLIGQYALFSRANNYQDYFNRFSRNNFIIGMSIQVPLFDGRRIDSRTLQGRQEVVEAESRIELMKRNLRLDVERAAGGLKLAAGARDLARREEAIAREALRVDEALFEGGRISPAALEVARDAVLEKQLSTLRSSQALFVRQVELLRSVGSLADLP